MPSTHSQRIEHWFGKEKIQTLVESMQGWYGPPILVGCTPSSDEPIYICGDGDFIGRMHTGSEVTLSQVASDHVRREVRRLRLKRYARMSPRQRGVFNGFSDLWSEISSGKGQPMNFYKTGVTGVVGVANDLFPLGVLPSAGATATALAAGAVPSRTTAGALAQLNPTSGDTLHFLGAMIFASVVPNCLMLYDRSFAGNHNLATTPQTVSGVPTRYQTSTTARGTFITLFVTTALGAGTPTYTITYKDQDNNTAEAAAAQTIVASAIARRFPFATTVGAGWFIPLNAGDVGVQSITNIALSAASTGNADVVIGKPIAWLPTGNVVNQVQPIDGIRNPMQASVQIENDACLALFEIAKTTTGATNYGGTIFLGSG